MNIKFKRSKYISITPINSSTTVRVSHVDLEAQTLILMTAGAKDTMTITPDVECAGVFIMITEANDGMSCAVSERVQIHTPDGIVMTHKEFLVGLQEAASADQNEASQ